MKIYRINYENYLNTTLKESCEIQTECFRLGIPFVQVNDVPTAMDRAWMKLMADPEST